MALKLRGHELFMTKNSFGGPVYTDICMMWKKVEAPAGTPVWISNTDTQGKTLVLTVGAREIRFPGVFP